MPGIWGTISRKKSKESIDLSDSFHKETGVSYINKSEQFESSCFGRFSVDKFQNDKVFKELNSKLICVEGIILNSKSLAKENSTNDISQIIESLYDRYNWKFVGALRGNFSGFVYFISNNTLIVFVDHLASKPIYYFYDDKTMSFIFASELNVVLEGMRRLGFIPHLDMDASYCLLTFGFMLGDITLVKEIKKIAPGCILIYGSDGLKVHQYYKLSSKPYIAADEETIIDQLDKRFKEAIMLEYEKDSEYGYSHIATLSGGLDSRTNIAYAKRFGISNITCINFSQSNYLDEIIAKQICSDKNLEYIFYALDNGNYLINDIDNIIESNGGLNFYSGAAHTYSCLKKLNFSKYGLVHTGQIGDLVLGSYLQDKIHAKLNKKMIAKLASSTRLVDKIAHITELTSLNYENSEMLAFYEKCINGVFNGYRMIEQFTEYSSPFLYIDFLDYAMKIPPKYRYNEAIYIKWVKKCLPEYSIYTWEKKGIAPKYPINFINFYSQLNYLKRLLKYRLQPKYSSMNPMDYWWNSNEALRKGIDDLFKENISIIERSPELFNDCTNLFNNGSLIEKTQVITLIRAVKSLDIDLETNSAK